MNTKSCVTAFVTACDADNNLLATCANGTRAYIPAEEATRRPSSVTINAKMVGKALQCEVLETLADGSYKLSAKKYEESIYSEIIEALKTHTKNVYVARRLGIARSAKIAYYEIAQGVAAQVHISDLSYNRYESFLDIELPYELPLVLIEEDSYGNLRASAKFAFGDFSYNVQKLGLEPGKELEGYVSGRLPSSGHLTVQLSPNVISLLEAGTAVNVGSTIKVFVSKVLPEFNKVRCQFVMDLGDAETNKNLDLAKYVVPIEQLPEYIDMVEFENRTKPKTGNKNTIVRKEEPLQLLNPNIKTSPFASFPDEIVVYDRPDATASTKKIEFEMRMSYLNDHHKLVAIALSDLHYATSYQLLHYLNLKNNVRLNERELNSILERLIKHDIIGSLHCSSQGKIWRSRIVFPGPNFQFFTGMKSFFYPHEYMEVSSNVKKHLSANQLLLGMLNSGETTFHEAHAYLMCDNGTGSKIRIKSRHRVTYNNQIIYLEGLRATGHEDMVQKLRRYEKYFASTNETAKVLITLENETELLDFAAKLRTDGGYSFDIGLVTDLKTIPHPDEISWIEKVVCTNTSSKSGFFRGLFAR